MKLKTYQKFEAAKASSFNKSDESRDASANVDVKFSFEILAMPIEERRKHAVLLSDGSKEYEKWLMNLWDNEIATFAGCSAIESEHPVELREDGVFVNAPIEIPGFGTIPPNVAFSTMIMTPETEKKIACIIDSLTSNSMESINVSFTQPIDTPMGEGNRAVGFHRKPSVRERILGLKGHISEKEADAFFKLLNDAFDRAKKVGFESDNTFEELQKQIVDVMEKDCGIIL